jgi:hypothetical protein
MGHKWDLIWIVFPSLDHAKLEHSTSLRPMGGLRWTGQLSDGYPQVIITTYRITNCFFHQFELIPKLTKFESPCKVEEHWEELQRSRILDGMASGGGRGAVHRN